ncbi:hypothetical protein BGZ76_009853 [Entomortierella beljakovae]|nr:hypothetical protein BGZ76_009853 [Entomortierella beljakovae]
MSKRATESQITKDDYERGDDEGSSVMGTFKKASNEELAKRSIRAMRRAPRTASDQEDGASKPSAFASFGSLPASTNSQQTPNAAKPGSAFSGFSFGAAPSHSTSTNISATTAAPAPILSTSDLADSEKGKSSPAFSSGAFTFNMGSNAKPLNVTEGGSPKDTNGDTTDKQEGYLRQLRGVNQSFIKKLEKEMERLPTVNLAQMFQGYIDVRSNVRRSFRGVEEPRAVIITDSKSDLNSNEGSPGSLRNNKVSRTGSASSDSQLQGFGLADITAASNKRSFSGFGTATDGGSTTTATTSGTTSSLTAPTFTTATMSPSSPSGFSGFGGTASMFGFGSSSMKGAVDPPKNPISSAWNFGTSNSSTAGISTSKPAIAPLNPTLNPFSSTTAANTAATPKPFTFNPPKPFTSTASSAITTATATTDGPPKPFAFQVPAFQPPTSTTSSSETAGQDDEKMPDDTKSQLVDSREGEEDETTVFETRAKLFACPEKAGAEYKDLGLGQFRVNEHGVTKKRRMIMRVQGTGLIVLNSWVIQGMPPVRENKSNITIFGIEDGKPKKFLVRVKVVESADDLFQALEAGQNK